MSTDDLPPWTLGARRAKFIEDFARLGTMFRIWRRCHRLVRERIGC